MAKRKSRKDRVRRAPIMYPKGAPTSSTVKARTSEASIIERRVSPAVKAKTSEDFREEYWYVYNDLKRIALVAGTLFAVLIVLSFII